MRNNETREGYDLWDKVHELPRFNFWRGGEDEKGSVIRVPEKHGNWINFNDLTTLADQYQYEINSLRERLARLELKSVKPCSPVAQYQGEPVALAQGTGILTFMRSTSEDANRCACCEGDHVFCRYFKGLPDFNDLTQDLRHRNDLEGREFRVTVELIAEQPEPAISPASV